jgi:hypothetical protein
MRAIKALATTLKLLPALSPLELPVKFVQVKKVSGAGLRPAVNTAECVLLRN